MGFPAESGEIMAQRTLMWLSGWRTIEVVGEVPISGGGRSSGPDYYFLVVTVFYPPRSVHNSRIERIWYDVTEGFGSKWKDFFTDLEASEGLDVNNPAHIWLLHHLFLGSINQDALSWAEAWNNHKLQIQGEPQQTPQEMYFFSMLEDGPRGLGGSSSQAGEAEQEGFEDGEDLTTFGIDWEDMDNEVLMEHHHRHNSLQADNPFSTTPSTLSEVICVPPDCPLSDEGIRQLDYYLSQNTNSNSHSILIRRNIWVEAIRICTQIL